MQVFLVLGVAPSTGMRKGNIIDGIVNPEDINYYGLDTRLSYDLNKIIGETNWFDPYLHVGADQTEMVAFIVEPPLPIVTFLYRCDSLFYTEPLEQMFTEKEIYGLFLLDRRECTIGILRGSRVEMLKYMTSQVPGKPFSKPWKI